MPCNPQGILINPNQAQKLRFNGLLSHFLSLQGKLLKSSRTSPSLPLIDVSRLVDTHRLLRCKAPAVWPVVAAVAFIGPLDW